MFQDVELKPTTTTDYKNFLNCGGLLDPKTYLHAKRLLNSTEIAKKFKSNGRISGIEYEAELCGLEVTPIEKYLYNYLEETRALTNQAKTPEIAQEEEEYIQEFIADPETQILVEEKVKNLPCICDKELVRQTFLITDETGEKSRVVRESFPHAFVNN
jgi:hypothetical protein